MIHVCHSQLTQFSISTIVCPVFRDNGSLTGLAGTSHKGCSKQQKKCNARAECEQIFTGCSGHSLSFALSLSLSLCSSLLQNNVRVRADAGQDSQWSSEHSPLIPPKRWRCPRCSWLDPAQQSASFSGITAGTMVAEGGWPRRVTWTITHHSDTLLAKRREAEGVFKTSLGPTLWQRQSPSCPWFSRNLRSEICPENSPETWPEISLEFARNFARRSTRNFSRNLSRNRPEVSKLVF